MVNGGKCSTKIGACQSVGWFPWSLLLSRDELNTWARGGTLPFFLAADAAGCNHPSKMSPDVEYEVVNDIESLPERPPLI